MGDKPAFRANNYRLTLSGPLPLVDASIAALSDLCGEPGDVPRQWTASADAGTCELRIDDEVAFTNVHPDAFTSHVVSTLTRRVLDTEPESLHFHALGVVADSAALIAAGSSGAGKSTLCAALVCRGADYMTDESVAIDPSGLHASSFPKPIVIKRKGLENVARIVQQEPPPEATLAWAIPGSSIGSLAESPQPVRTVVSYRRSQDGRTHVEPIHRATLAHELLTDSPDVERFGPAALMVVARLLTSSQCLRASGPDAYETAGELLRWHREPFATGEAHDVPPADRGTGTRRAADVRSVIIDGRAVLMNATTKALVELDEQTTSWWRLLDGTATNTLVDEIADATGAPVPDVGALGDRVITELTTAGLLDVG